MMIKTATAKCHVTFGLLIFTGLLICSCAAPLIPESETVDARWLTRIDNHDPVQRVAITEPADGAVYPMDIASPLFQWQGPDVGSWLIKVETGHLPNSLYFGTSRNPWVPTLADWDRIKAFAPGSPLRMTVMQVQGKRTTASGTVRFSISPVPMACRVVYQELPVPFGFAEKHVNLFRWRSFAPDTVDPPETVMTNLPYCGNCHIFSKDGSVFGLDTDYRGDRGGYALVDVARNVKIQKQDIISWNDYLPGEGPTSRGLFAKISPSGKHVIATIKDQPFLVRINDPAYSQLFFPLSGILAYYSRQSGMIRPLNGADDSNFVQTSPAWSPDSRTIVFARSRLQENLRAALGDKHLLDALPGEDIHDLNRKYQMRFDLWQVPFSNGAGGQAVPLSGASANGKSNYFPRYSPDGRWIVFCQSDTGLVSQPGSRLMIIPAAGGTAREMICNRTELNSWHSFSPNGHWLVFSSKPDDSRLTRVYLTHIDEQGKSTPAVRLHRIGTTGMAAILPEAVSLSKNTFRQVRLVEP